MFKPNLPRTRGFTLVELLVVIAIIGVLIALLLPAVQAAREAARRSQCRNNLKQLAIALHNYHDARKILPPSIQIAFNERPEYTVKYQSNWIIMTLPYMEQQNTYDQFNFKKYISDPLNRVARGVDIPALWCPSDTGHDMKFVGTLSGEGDNWARGNYAANGANGPLQKDDRSDSSGKLFNLHAGKSSPPQPAAKAPGWVDPNRRGVMGCNVSLKLPQITDGTSKTLLLAEVRVGLNEKDRRGTWALPNPAASALFWHGNDGDDNGPNACNDQSDDLDGCTYLNDVRPGNAVLMKECMSCWSTCPNYQGGSKSKHDGGVFVAFADGSVHFMTDLVDTGGPWATTFHVWDRVITCCDGKLIKSSDLEIHE